MKTEAASIFAGIIDTRSLTVIHYKVDDALEGQCTDDDRAALQAILRANLLDEVWAIAHERLGQHEKAAELRQFIAAKSQRKGQQHYLEPV